MLPYVEILGRGIPTYGLLMSMGLLLAGGLAVARTIKRGLDIYNLFIIAAVALGVGLIGAKVLYWVVTYSPKEFWDSLLHDSLSLLNGGGLVFYGGLLGGFAGAFLGARLAKTDLFAYETTIIPCVPLGHAIGRLGCIAAGCCYGFAYNGPFAIHYPFLQTGSFPVQAVEAVGNLIIAFVLAIRARKPCPRYLLISLYGFLYGIQRFFMEYLRGDAERGKYGQLSTSQWISLLLVVVAAIAWLVQRCKTEKTAE